RSFPTVGRYSVVNRMREMPLFQPVESVSFATALMYGGGSRRGNQDQEGRKVAGQVVPEKGVIRDFQESDHCRSPAGLRTSCVVSLSFNGMAPVCSTFSKTPFCSPMIFVLFWSCASSFPRKSPFSMAVR